MSRVAILCTQHVPDDVRVTHRLGRRLREEGHEVTWVGPRRQRTGDGYGIQFVFYPLVDGKLGRLTQSQRLRRACRTLPQQDVYLAVAPDAAMVAVALARQHGSVAVFDIQERYHEDMLRRWVPQKLLGPAGWLVQWSMRRLCRACDLVVGVGQSRLDPYTDDRVPRMIVRHCVPSELASSLGKSALPEKRDHLVILHGKTSRDHGTVEVMRAVAVLHHTFKIPCRVIMFRERSDLPSHGQTPVGQLAAELDVASCIDLRDPVPYREMFRIMQECDVGLIAYRRALGIHCMPNRIFEYMAAGLPVVVPTYAEEMRRLLDRYEIGLHCDTEDPGALAAALQACWQDKARARRHGANGRMAFETELNWEAESRPLMDWIRNPPPPRKRA